MEGFPFHAEAAEDCTWRWPARSGTTPAAEAATPQAEPAPAPPRLLPADFPGAKILTEAGFGTLESVAALTREQRIALHGIGAAIADQIEAALVELGASPQTEA